MEPTSINDNNNTTEQNESSGKVKKAKLSIPRIPKKHVKKLIILLIVIIIPVTLLFLLVSKDEVGVEVSKDSSLPCTGNQELLSRASDALDVYKLENRAQLPGIAEEVLGFENYQNDSYCLRILTQNYISISDYENSKKYMDALDSLNENDISTEVIANFASIVDLRNIVEGLGRMPAEIEKNNPYVSGWDER